MPIDVDGYEITNTNVRMYEQTSIVRSGLVLHLEASIFNTVTYGTTWFDLSGNENNAALINGPTYGSENGGVINFDGINDYAIISSIANYRSISLWAFVSSKNTYLFDARTGSPLGYFWFPELGPDWDQLYVNGSLVSTSTTSVPENVWFNLYARNTSTRSGTINLFSRYTNNEFQSGKYAQFLAYNRELSVAEIAHNYNVTKGRFGL